MSKATEHNLDNEPDALTAAYFKGCADTKERMRKKMAKVEEQRDMLLEALEFFVKHTPTEFVYDENTYKRMVNRYKKTAQDAIKTVKEQGA